MKQAINQMIRKVYNVRNWRNSNCLFANRISPIIANCKIQSNDFNSR